MKKTWKWIKDHVRPYIKRSRKEKSTNIDLKEDSPREIIDKARDESEVGIKFTFKF